MSIDLASAVQSALYRQRQPPMARQQHASQAAAGSGDVAS